MSRFGICLQRRMRCSSCCRPSTLAREHFACVFRTPSCQVGQQQACLVVAVRFWERSAATAGSSQTCGAFQAPLLPRGSSSQQPAAVQPPSSGAASRPLASSRCSLPTTGAIQVQQTRLPLCPFAREESAGQHALPWQTAVWQAALPSTQGLQPVAQCLASYWPEGGLCLHTLG